MLGFIFRLRLKQIFIDDANGLALGLRYIMIFLSIAYAVLYGFALNEIDKSKNLSESAIMKIQAGFLVFAVMSFIVKNYFPQYKGSTRFIATIYPVSSAKRALGHLINDLTSSLFIAFGLFYSILTAVSNSLTWHPIPAMILALFSWILADRNLRRCIDFQLISNTLHTVISGLSLTGLGFVLSLHFSSIDLTSKWLVLFYGSLTVILFVHGLWIDASILEIQERGFSSDEQSEETSLMKLLLNISTRSARIRTGYIVAIGTKLFLGLIGVFISARGEKTQILDIYQYLILSPVFPLTQIFFNTFGFYREFWLAGELFSSSRLAMIKIWIRYISYVLAFDVVVSFALMLTIYSPSWHMLVYYVITIPILVSIALKASFVAPLYVENPLMTKNTNTGAIGHALLSMVLVALFGVLTHFKWEWILLPVVGWWFYHDLKKWPKLLAKRGPTVYDKLYK